MDTICSRSHPGCRLCESVIREDECQSFVTFEGDFPNLGTGVDGPDTQDVPFSWGKHPLLLLKFECCQSEQSASEDMLEGRPGLCLELPGECTNPQREGSEFCDEHYWQRKTDDGYIE